MGTAAFLMADLSGAGYLNVAKAALLPAILYYLALLVMIHFEAVKNDLGKLSPDMVPETKSVVSRLYYLVPIAVLILLLGMGRSVVFCANIATLSIVLLAMLKAETRFTFKSFIEALVASSRGALMVSACCACSGLIVGVLSLTGIGYKFINLITILAGDSLFLLMVYLMLTSFVLGMGIPTTPAYIVVATLGAPALIKAGAPQLVAHMFVFYYAILSFITPPVCVAAFAGAIRREPGGVVRNYRTSRANSTTCRMFAARYRWPAPHRMTAPTASSSSSSIRASRLIGGTPISAGGLPIWTRSTGSNGASRRRTRPRSCRRRLLPITRRRQRSFRQHPPRSRSRLIC